ncbi:MAG: SGNH/GDSL hydrolase family protein [Gemmatimonadaceae bacterium]|nr:SGNH/GDSL hydrolase family protein [Gemmatimonadaceae bacterium]
MQRKALFAAIALLIAMTMAAMAAEVLVRVVARPGTELAERLRPYDPFAILVEPHGFHGYRPRPGVVVRYRNGTAAHINARGFRGVTPAAGEDSTRLRVAMLGGSTTFGWGVDDSATIGAYLTGLLDSLMPGRAIEVVNAAFDGYDSHQLLERLLGDVLPLRPQVVVINSGINDVRSARYSGLEYADPRTLFYEAPMRRMREEQARGRPYLWSRVKHASKAVQLAALTRTLVMSTARARPLPATRFDIYPDAADYFESNVRRMIDSATARGAVVLLSTPPSSLRENHAPDETSTIAYWLNDAAETQVYRDTLAARLRGIAESYVGRGARVEYLRPSVPPAEFLDDAHLTGPGNRLVAEQFAPVIARLLAPRAP